MSPIHRWVLKSARTIHVYATLFGLTLILFFAVTGFMLNHIEWFEAEQIRTANRALPLDKLPSKTLPEPDATGEATGDAKLAIVESLRKEFAISAEMTSFGFAEESDEQGESKKVIKVEFKRAGEICEAKIDRANAHTSVEWKFQGWPAVLTDLHRGNRGNRTNEVAFTGKAWMLLIDCTCLLLVVISLTGLVLWWSLKARGKWGAIWMLIGGVGTLVVYYLFVP